MVAIDRARERIASDAATGGGAGLEEEPHDRAAVARVLVFSALLAVGTVLPLLWGPLSRAAVIRHLAPEGVAVPLLVVLFAAVGLAPVVLRLRGQVALTHLSEVPLLLGIVMVSPILLVLSRLLGEAIAFGLVRRQVWYKLVFNLAEGAFACVVALSAYRAVLGEHTLTGALGWAAAAAGLVAAVAVSRISVEIVIRLHGERPKLNRRPDSAGVLVALVSVTSVALAVIVLDAAVRDMAAVAPLLLVGMLIVFAYRRYVRLTDRFGALQQLYDFSRSVGAMSLESTSIGWAIVEQVLDVMRTRRADLVVLEGGGARRLSIDENARRSSEPITFDRGSLLTQAVREGHPVFRSGRTSHRGREPLADPLLGEFEEVIAVPVTSADRVIGVLVAVDRAPGFAALDEDDVRLFEALAAHASTTLERARLVEELRLEAEAKSYQATHDALTGLPNRTLFVQSAGASLGVTGRAAIALLDLDRFKEVNDTLGHGMGDLLLCEVAARLLEVASGHATVARLGGDEFALVIPGVIGPEEATGIVRDIESAIAHPFHIEGITLAVTASAGVSLAPQHGDNVALLLQRADIAMYHAKDKHSGIELYSASHDNSMQRKLLLAGQLSEALTAGEQLSVVFQPIARFETGEVVRVEALMRWFHPTHGQVQPDEFIDIAEQTGLIGRITDFVLREGCSRISGLRAKGHEIGLTLNLSGQDLGDRAIVTKIAETLREFDLPASALSIEVTETEMMADIREASRVLAELAELGVGIAVDDYGTGYSSLAYLHSLPLNELKLDRSFVGDIAANESNAIIVRSSIAMAHSLGLSVVAEGAEDELTCAMLADAGCDALQGYYLSPPLSADALTDWLLTRPRLRYTQLASPQALRVIPGRLHELG